jgi:hypothetical protein
MDCQLSRYGFVYQVEGLFELGRPVAGGELMGDHAGGQVQSGVEVDGTVADVVMGAPLGRPGEQREHWLSTVQGLDLGFLVDTDHHRPLGRVHVQSHDVADLVDEKGVGRQLEAVLEPRFEPKGGRQMSSVASMPKSGCCCAVRSTTPGGCRRSALQRPLYERV